jgi:hypothetical protein
VQNAIGRSDNRRRRLSGGDGGRASCQALTERMMTLVAKDVRACVDMGIPFQHVGVNVSCADMHAAGSKHARRGVRQGKCAYEARDRRGDGNRVHGRWRPVRPYGSRDPASQGFRVALDDFGTGYASLTHLLTVPVDIIKIDKSFVDRLAPGNASMVIAEGLLQIARKLDIRVIAEGD